MNKQTWVFHTTTGTIPGIPGEWHAGLEVDVDTDEMTVLDVRLHAVPASAPATEETPVVQAPQEIEPELSLIQVITAPLQEEGTTSQLPEE